MKSFSAVLVLATVAFAQTASDPNAYANGLVAALKGAGLQTLAAVATANAAVLGGLVNLPAVTVFAPTDRAFANLAVAANVTLDPASAGVFGIVAYHIVPAAVDPTKLGAGHTLFGSSSTVVTSKTAQGNATGHVRQLVLTAGPAGLPTVVQATAITPSIMALTYMNINLFVIDSVLTVPTVVTDVIATVPTLTTLVAAVGADSGLGPNVDLLPSLTLFAPANSAFQALAKAYPAITSATGGEITGLILNHAVVGTFYSTDLAREPAGSSVAAIGGQRLTVISNTTGIYIVAGSVVSKVIQSDIITDNGVVHIIDTVLFDIMAAMAPTAASSSTAAPVTSSAAAPAASSLAPLPVTSATVPASSAAAPAASASAATGTVAPKPSASATAAGAGRVSAGAVGALGLLVTLFA